MAVTGAVTRNCWAGPRKPLLDLPELRYALLRDRQRLNQHTDVTKRSRDWINIPLLFDDKLAHESVPLFDTSLGERAGIAEVLPIRGTGSARCDSTWSPHGWYRKIAGLHSLYGRTR